MSGSQTQVLEESQCLVTHRDEVVQKMELTMRQREVGLPERRIREKRWYVMGS